MNRRSLVGFLSAIVLAAMTLLPQPAAALAPTAQALLGSNPPITTAGKVVANAEVAAQPEDAQANLPCTVPQFTSAAYGNASSALVSTAMVFKYFGVNTDPTRLQQCLNNAGTYFTFERAASLCSENKVSYVQRSTSSSSSAEHKAPLSLYPPSPNPFSYSVLQQELAAGRPVIVYNVGLPWEVCNDNLCQGDSGGVHTMVVTAGSGVSPSGYSINDPGYNGRPPAQRLDAFGTPYSMFLFSGQPACLDVDGGDIGYGQTRSGAIDPMYDYDDFYFNAAVGDLVEIRQNRATGSLLDSYLELYDPAGTLIAFDDDGGGDRNAWIPPRTLTSGGRYRIRAKAYMISTGAYTLSLVGTARPPQCGDCEGDPRWIALWQTLNGTIIPASDRDTYYFSGVAGRLMSIRMTRTSGALDPYLELWSPSGMRVATNDDGAGDLNSWIVYRLPWSGVYRISAYSYNNASTGTYSLRLESTTGVGAGDLALNRPVGTSSVEFSGVEGWKAVDGNPNTRWSSRFSDPQWVWVDLGQDRWFDMVVLNWENAYARRFGIYYQTESMCSTCWNNVFWTDNGGGGTQTILFNPVRARYVLMYGAARGTGWGYSLWEFEVYDTSTTVTPVVPPDDPGKPSNAPEVMPLAPVEGDKDVVLAGEGEFGQEYAPIASGEPLTLTEERQEPQTVVAFIRSPDPDLLYLQETPSGRIRFAGTASSQGTEGALEITAWEWRSDRDGVIGNQADFTLPEAALSPGMHTITMRAQNEQGIWSETMSTVIVIAHRTFFPTILK